jgi:prevent-host-death family protein
VRIATQNQVAAEFTRYLKVARTAPVVVTRKGRPVAVLLGTEDEEDLERLLMGHSPKLQSILESARQRFRAGRGIAHETFWTQVEAESAKRTLKRKQTNRRNDVGR